MYVEKFFGTFCYKDGTEVNISIREYEEVEPPLTIPPKELTFAGTADAPVTLSYSDTDYKLQRINGAELTVRVKSNENFELSSLDTQNEKQWLIIVTGAFQFTGFLIPDGASEPYDSKPYNVTLRFTDSLATLKDVPFLDYQGRRLTGYHNDIFYLRQIFQKTKIDINIGVAINTLADGMTVGVCPLEQMYTDAARYYDNDGLPYSCWDVLDAILIRNCARLHQFNNKWQIVNVLQLAEQESIKMWNYDYLMYSLAPSMIGNSIEAGGQTKPLRPTEAIHSTAKALASSTAYYQYGYPSNQVLNGSFNDWTTPMVYPNHWIPIGGATGGTGTRAGTTNDYFLKVSTTPAFTDRIQTDTNIQIRQGETVDIRFTVGVSEVIKNALIGPLANDKCFIEVTVLSTDQKFYAQTQTGTAWFDGYGVMQLLKYGRDFAAEIDINFTVAARDTDYLLVVGFKVLNVSGGTPQEIYIDNVEVKPSVASKDVKLAVGEYLTLSSLTDQSYKSDPLRLLHSDEPNTKRTSVISIGSPTTIVPSTLWQRAGHSGEGLTLLEMVADTELIMHSRPYKVFEGTFKGFGWIDINSIVTIEQMPGKYMFLSGTFDFKEGNHVLKFAEILIDPVPKKAEFLQDFGALKDKEGVSVGAPNGINITGGTSQTNPGGITMPIKATLAEVTTGTNDAEFVTPYTFAERLSVWWSAKIAAIQTITAKWVFSAGFVSQAISEIRTGTNAGLFLGSLNTTQSFIQSRDATNPKDLLIYALYTNIESGNLGVGYPTAQTEKFAVNGTLKATKFKLSALNAAPASATAAGGVGDISIDANYIYICIAANTWKRTPLATW